MGSSSTGRRPQSLAHIALAAAILMAGFSVQAWRSGRASTPASAGVHAEPLAFVLEEVSGEAGIAHRHEVLKLHPSLSHVAKFITAIGGAAVAIVDHDGDGWQDIYLTTMAVGAPNRLFANRGDGTFRDVAPQVGLADVNREAGSLRPLFFDFENDGDRDLVLTTTYCPRVFRNDGGAFVDVTDASGIDHCGFASASNVVDFDRDGDLDLVIADFYAPVDLRAPERYDFMPYSMFGAVNGGPLNVYRNNGDGTFSRATDNLGLDEKEWRGFVHAIGVYDLQGRGASDLYFAVDFNFTDRMFHDRGDGSFEDVSSMLQQKYSHSSMSAEIADFRNTGLPAIFVSDIHAPGWLPSENLLWDVTPGGEFRDAGGEVGVSRCGWAWGAKFVDLDNDSWQDLVVTNGFFSDHPEKQYWYQTSMLQGGNRAITSDARQWPAIEDRSMSGYQRPCVFSNREGRFTNVVERTGMRDDRSDGRGIAAIDLLNDGSVSLVVANLGQPAQLFRNRQRNDHHWIGFQLVGTRSGTDAFGTRVRIYFEGARVLSRELRPTNGYLSQSDARLHFGLGREPRIERITVVWPSGLQQDFHDLELDRYHRLREPDADGIVAIP